MRRLRLSPNRGMNLALVWLVHRPCGRQQWQRHKQNIPHPMECGLPTRCAANHHSIPSTPPSIATLARNHLPSPRAAPRDDEWGELQGQEEKDDDDDDDDDRLHTRAPTRRPMTIRAPTPRPSTKPVETKQPSQVPSSKPVGSKKPSHVPSSKPSRDPSTKPSRDPSAKPSRKPSSMPSGKPSGKDSGKPVDPCLVDNVLYENGHLNQSPPNFDVELHRRPGVRGRYAPVLRGTNRPLGDRHE